MSLSLRHSDAYPVRDRIGSEHTNPEAPQTRTNENHESIRVAHEGNLAVRISPSGYRVLFQTEGGGRYFLWDHRGQKTFSLHSLSGVVGAIDWLVTEGKTSEKAAVAAKAAMQRWPEMASHAWYLLHRGPGTPLPPFAPAGMFLL